MKIELLYIKYLAQGQKITTDTRKISPGFLFFALKGANYDGNKFALEAINLGAKYAIVDDVTLDGLHPNIILVQNVLATLQELALFHRRKLNIPIIAITGSNGKTTTKELIKEVLSKKYKVSFTLGNLNNHIGVPLTLLSIEANSDIAIVEMGANHVGEIESYCKFTEPNYALITNIGKAHLEGFGNFEGVIKAKSELYDYIRSKKGIVFVNQNDPLLYTLSNDLNCVYYANSIQSNSTVAQGDTETLSVTIDNSDDITIHSQLSGKYNLYNILAAYTIGQYFEVKTDDIVHAITSYKPTNGRSQLIKQGSNLIILDAYNANPTSMENAIQNLISFSGDHIAILGGMKELGEYSAEEHNSLVELCLNTDIKIIALLGEEFQHIPTSTRLKYFDTKAKLKDWFLTSSFNNATILIKGSRYLALESILD